MLHSRQFDKHLLKRSLLWSQHYILLGIYWWYYSTAVALAFRGAVGICAWLSWSTCSEIGVQLDSATGSRDGVWHHDGVGLHSLECLAGNLLECLLNWDALLGWGFIERNTIVGIAPLLALASVNFALALTINFIAQHDEREGLGLIRGGVIDETLLPFGQVLEGLAVCNVVDKNAAVSTSVESIAERLELFLTGCIPDL